jgi:hypothetical protein
MELRLQAMKKSKTALLSLCSGGFSVILHPIIIINDQYHYEHRNTDSQ